MWQLIFILSTGVSQVGVYDTKTACEADAVQWTAKGVNAGCVQQLSPEQSAAKMMNVFRSFVTVIEGAEKK